MNIEDMETAAGARSPAGVIAEGLRGFVETLAPIAEAMTGYRRSLVAQGWSEAVAEQVAGTLLAHWNAEVVRLLSAAAAEHIPAAAADRKGKR